MDIENSLLDPAQHTMSRQQCGNYRKMLHELAPAHNCAAGAVEVAHRVLVVDTNPMTLAATIRILRDAGCSVFRAMDGIGALSQVRVRHPSLVLLCVDLPDISGTEVLRRIRGDATLDTVSVVLIDARAASPDEQAYAFDCGADGYIVRPIAGVELAARVRAQLRQHDRMNGSRTRTTQGRMLIEQQVDAVVVVDCLGTIRYANPAAGALFGCHPNDLEGVPFGFPIVADEASKLQELDIPRGNHLSAVTEMRVTPIEWEGQRAWIASLRDITEAHRAQRRIETLLNLKSLLCRTNEMIARTLPLSELFDGICQACASDGRFELAWIGMADQERQALRCVAQAGSAADYAKQLFISLDPILTTGQGPSALAVRDGKEFIINDYMASPLTSHWHEVAKQYGLAAAAGFPLRLHGQPVGHIAVYSSRTNFFGEELTDLLRRLAASISFAMDAAEAEAERQRAELKLRESEQKFRTLVESPLAGIAICEGGRIRYANDRFAEIFACLPTDLVGGKFNWIGAEQTELIRGIEQELTEDLSPKQLKMPATRRNGEQMIIECHFSRTAPGQQGSYVLMLQDITERERVEQALKESEERFRATFENAAVSIARISVDGKCLAVNENFSRLLGYSSNELKEKNICAMIYPDDQRAFHVAVEELRAGGQRSVAFDKRFVRKNGEIVWGRGALSARRDAVGNLLDFINVVADITAQRKAEEEVGVQIEQLAAALRGTLEAASRIVEQRDPYTAGHERRVGEIAAAVAKEMGFAEDRCVQIDLAGLVHDIGKVSVPAEILTYPGRLDPIQMELLKTHAEKGYQVLKDLPFGWPLAEIVRQHHERMDGSGYPRGLKEDAILLEARILAVADVLESMAAHRPYRPALGVEAGLAEIIKGRGSRYDAGVVDAAVRLIRERGYRLPADQPAT